MADLAIVEFRIFVVDSKTRQCKMSHGDVGFSYIRGDNVLMDVMGEKGRKLMRVRLYRKCENGPRLHCGNCVTSPAECAAGTVDITSMTPETRCMRRKGSYIWKRLLLISAGGRPVFCRESVTCAAVTIFSLLVGPRVVRKRPKPLLSRRLRQEISHEKKRDEPDNKYSEKTLHF